MSSWLGKERVMHSVKVGLTNIPYNKSLMKKNFLPVSIVVVGIILALGVVLGQGVLAQGFGFEKNIDARKSADAESVAGCMLSCEDMVAGRLVMNPSSPNYIRQGEKIEAKAQQCLGMNTLAGFPFTEAEILASCGLEAQHCVEVPAEDVRSGACTALPFTGELLGLPQCCIVTAPIDCGVDAEWVVGIAAVPTCYIPNS